MSESYAENLTIACCRNRRIAEARRGRFSGHAGQYLRQDPDAADVQVLTKACIWGNNLYQAGKGKILEQARTPTPPSLWQLTSQCCWPLLPPSHINTSATPNPTACIVAFVSCIFSIPWHNCCAGSASLSACVYNIFRLICTQKTLPSSAQEYIDVSRRRLGQPTLELLQFYWHDYSIKNYVDAALRLTDMQVRTLCAPSWCRLPVARRTCNLYAVAHELSLLASSANDVQRQVKARQCV